MTVVMPSLFVALSAVVVAFMVDQLGKGTLRGWGFAALILGVVAVGWNISTLFRALNEGQYALEAGVGLALLYTGVCLAVMAGRLVLKK